MRENIGVFRGKRKDNGNWAEGSLIHSGNYWAILQNESELHPMDMPYLDSETGAIDGKATPVDPETVGEFTGLTDKNGKRIFEGDICHFYGGEHYIGCWETNLIKKIELCHESLWYLGNAEYVEVIGNIHDNPELLERE
ncbi:MAG: hypothetical protein IJ740_18825 [Ruminococcus sp.]|nr:hypothetical protein [Ruminococcus sp.]MBR1752896.1 hypothetical protein [Ruminococcus sp.]